ADDPYELKNLIDDPARSDLRAEMDAKLAAWMERTGDSWSFNSMEPVEDQGRLYRFGAFTTIQEYLDWTAEHPGLAPKDGPGGRWFGHSVILPVFVSLAGSIPNPPDHCHEADTSCPDRHLDGVPGHRPPGRASRRADARSPAR